MRHRHKERPDRKARQGRQSGHPARGGYRHRRSHRDHRRRRHDRHRRWHRFAHPFHLPAADRGSADVRRHDHDRRRHGACDGNLRDDLHAGTVAYSAHARSRRGVPDEPRLSWQGQCEPHPAPGRANRGRGDRTQAARGLGHDAGSDRCGAQGRGPDGCAGRDPYRYAQRVGLRRDDAAGNRRQDDPYLSHRGRGRRPRAGHHQGLRRAQRVAVVDQSDAAVYGEYHRRASRHADGVPPPRSGDRRGRGLCRVAHPPRDDRGGGHSARSGCVLDALVRLAGDGSRGRSDHPHLADRAQDEAAARQARQRPCRAR